MTYDKKELLLKVLAVSTEFVIYMDYNASVKFNDNDLAVEIFDYQQLNSRMGISFVSHITRIAAALGLNYFIYCRDDGPIIHLF